MPTTQEALVIVILFVIPGFLGQWVIDRFIVRPGKTDLQTILTSIAASCATWAFWYPVMLLVRHLSSNVAVQVVLLFLALFVTPVVGALVMSAPDLRVRTWVNERLYTWLHLRLLNPRHGMGLRVRERWEVLGSGATRGWQPCARNLRERVVSGDES